MNDQDKNSKSKNPLEEIDIAALQQMPLTVELAGKIVNAIQIGIYGETAWNRKNYSSEPQRIKKSNGQYLITDIVYARDYSNSLLDIVYPSTDTMERRPTIIYLHGGGFFGGSKSEGDPLAVGNPANQMLDDLVSRGFNIVNVEYALTPEGHFPIPLIQLNQAINFLKSHADDYNLDMRNVVIFGSSAGASLTIQYGTMLANPKYCKELDIYPKIEPANLKALIVDDVALFPENFNWALTVMLGNYMQTVDLQDRKLNELFNPCDWFNSNMSPVFLDAGTTDGFPQDMLRCGELLTELGVPNEVFIPDAELPHGFLNLINESSEAKRGYEHLTAFIEKYTK